MFQPRTPLELELFAALGKSEDVLHPKKELTAAEEKALKAMSIQEVSFDTLSLVHYERRQAISLILSLCCYMIWLLL